MSRGIFSMASPGAQSAKEYHETILRIRDDYSKAYFSKFGVLPSPDQINLVVGFVMNERDMLTEEWLR